MPKVFIVGGDYSISSMFLQEGWKLATSIGEDIDLIQFTGGEDVDPSYYKETKHPATYSNPRRDADEALVYNEWVGKIPMAGICRGAQFLNVMNGGKLWQHVSNHAIRGTHEAFCVVTQETVEVTSTHHQMMIPSEKGEVLMFAKIADLKANADKTYHGQFEPDVESVFYPETKTLCYQPHPEFVNVKHPCRENYFQLLKDFLL